MSNLPKISYWKNSLMDLFNDTLRSKFIIIKETDLVWVIRDKFPKAKEHYLIVPKIKIVHGIPDLRREHIPILQHMQEIVETFPGYVVGFHRVPSLFQLHLHVLSPDLSLCKTKKHKDSFQMENMITLEAAIKECACR